MDAPMATETQINQQESSKEIHSCQFTPLEKKEGRGSLI